ncbi:hypothetical protein NUSPORA_01660 [Nucleospora cyclopteri]
MVDEINQGMDEQNELKVYKILKEISSTNQLFIITPKLMSNFEYPEATRVLIINGGINVKAIENYILQMNK